MTRGVEEIERTVAKEIESAECASFQGNVVVSELNLAQRASTENEIQSRQ